MKWVQYFHIDAREYVQAIKVTTCPVTKLNKTREILDSLRLTFKGSKMLANHVNCVKIQQEEIIFN